MGDDTRNYQELFSELALYEKKGVNISMDGLPASPMQIVNAHIVRENTTYMRDYIWNEDGDMKEVCVYNIDNK